MIYAAVIENRGYLSVKGDDSRDFLQGLLTNDLYKVSQESSIYALLLSPQGKYAYDLILSEDPNGALFLEADQERLQSLLSRLNLYKLRSQVNISLEPDFAVVALWGTSRKELLEGLELPDRLGATQTTSLWTGMVDPRHRDLGVRLIINRSRLPVLAECLGVTLMEAEDYKYHRIGLGIPESSEELITDKSIPLECGMDDFHAIDWDKGCYVGQELTARTKYRGLVRKGLVPMIVMGAVDQESPIQVDGEDVGVWYTLCRDRGLALVRLEALDKKMTSNAVEVMKI